MKRTLHSLSSHHVYHNVFPIVSRISLSPPPLHPLINVPIVPNRFINERNRKFQSNKVTSRLQPHSPLQKFPKERLVESDYWHGTGEMLCFDASLHMQDTVLSPGTTYDCPGWPRFLFYMKSQGTILMNSPAFCFTGMTGVSFIKCNG
jgi:hypothetical protein